MLILTRRVGEAIKIGDDIEMRILGIRGHQVRIGINAPKEVSVHREEIYAKVLKERELKERKEGICSYYTYDKSKSDFEKVE